ncbi:MAG: hypothetical protein INQ03_03530 [Candidatus Heimdallarchaeota archaeon]|nr:hypothetical protein [Candidatus Heimdallarchaeota archaeon]
MTDEQTKLINGICIAAIMEKKNSCKCRNYKQCIHAGKMSLALTILAKNGFDIKKINHLLIAK